MRKGYPLDIQPEDAELSMWFEDLPFDDREGRNKEFKLFVDDVGKELGVDLKEVYVLEIVKNEDETAFCNEAEKILNEAGYDTYQSDNFFDVFKPLPQNIIDECYDQ